MGCGATGAEGAVSAQNQPILNQSKEKKYVKKRRQSRM
jgi:hypothetical protein